MYSGEKSPNGNNYNEDSMWDILGQAQEGSEWEKVDRNLEQKSELTPEERMAENEANINRATGKERTPKFFDIYQNMKGAGTQEANRERMQIASEARSMTEEEAAARKLAMDQAKEEEFARQKAELEARARARIEERQRQQIEDTERRLIELQQRQLPPEVSKQLEDDLLNIDDMLQHGRISAGSAEKFRKEVIDNVYDKYATAAPEPANIDAINQGLGQETQPAQPEQEPTGSTDTVDQAMSETYPGLANVWDDAAVKQARDEWVDSQPGLANLSEQDKATVEKVTDQEIKETLGKAKKNRNFKRFLVRVLGVALAVGALAGFIAGVHNRQDNAPAENPAPIESVDQNQPVYDSYDEYAGLTSEAQESEKGIHDGYDKKGMWLSENKGGHNRFAAGQEVAEACNNDEVEMIKYTADNQSESMADYIANLPEELQPEGFKGLSIIETEQKLENLSDDEYENVKQQFNDAMDKAFTRRTTLNGKYHNSYMRLKDEAKGVTHDNMELVECTTTENNVEVNQFYWLDENGNEIGSMTVKIFYDENGDITGGCLQVVNPVESEKSHIYGGLTSIEESQDDDSGTGLEGTGGTGSEGTGDTGSEGTGETGSEGTDGTGSEGTGSEGTDGTGLEGTGSEGTGSEGTGSEGTGSEGTGSEGTDIIESKDAQNLERIDQNILDDIADDIGTETVTINNEDTIPVNQETVTVAPDESDYEGTEATIVENDQTPAAEPVQETISEDNNDSENRGGANADEFAPVQADEEARAAANAAEIPASEAPSTVDQADDTLRDLGTE